MDEASAQTVVAVPAGATACTDAQQHAEPLDPEYLRKVFQRAAAGGACGRVAVLGTVSYVFVHTVRLASYEPRQVAFFAGAHAVATSLVICLSRRCAARRLKAKPDSSSHDGHGFWVKTTEDAATDFLFWVFGFRVAEVGPPALTELVWCVMAVMSCGFVYMVYRDDDLNPYQALGEVRCDEADDAGDSKAVEKVKCTDEMV